MLGLIGEKLGMTHVYDSNGENIAVTVVKAGPCTVAQVKTKESDGYDAIQVGFGTPKADKVNKPCKGHFEKHGVGYFTELREYRVENAGEFKVGQKITVAAFQPGDTVDVQGITKGRGFQGVIKRHGKHGGPASHGSDHHRRPGSIGMRTWPARVFKNMKLPGHMGVVKVTTKNLKIVEVRAEEDLLFISGCVPGWRQGLVSVINKEPGFDSRPELKATVTEENIQEETQETKQPEAEKVEEQAQDKTASDKKE